MLHFFSSEDVREKLLGKEKDVVDRFIYLCENDTEFLGAIERTTKSIEANIIRFNKWREVVVELSGVDLAPIEMG